VIQHQLTPFGGERDRHFGLVLGGRIRVPTVGGFRFVSAQAT
jgi:hypothetical protein